MKLMHAMCVCVDRTVLVKIEEFADDNFTSYFWPFTVVVSICFLGVVIFSVREKHFIWITVETLV